MSTVSLRTRSGAWARAALRAAVTPPFYRHDIIEQFDSIGVKSLTVVLLTMVVNGLARLLIALTAGKGTGHE